MAHLPARLVKPQAGWTKVPRTSFPAQSPHDWVVLEEALHLTLVDAQHELPWASVLRTPGHDFELALGYLYSLELINSARDLHQMTYCSKPQTYNRLRLFFRDAIPELAKQRRNVDLVHAGCGSCGQDLEHFVPAHPVQKGPIVSQTWLRQLPDSLRSHQQLFKKTGGSHAAGWFEAGQSQPLAVFEDVGRHNAVDKLVGWGLMQNKLPASGSWLMLSGRAGFELVQKAIRAGFSGVASVGPPSSLAASMAEQAGLVLIGFLREESFNCYSHSQFIEDLPTG